MKIKLIDLRDSITNNVEYLSQEYPYTNDILEDLYRVIYFELSYSSMYQWWIENEDKIDIIHKLLERQK